VNVKGNLITAWMHLLVFHELNRLRVTHEWPIEKILPEKTVLLTKNGSVRSGRFDFLVQTKDKSIGIEVLTRPSQGKLKQKLAYASEVDEFVFVVPKEALEFYKKKDHKIPSRVRPSFFGKEFKSPNLKAWIVDLADGRILKKSVFSKVFNTK